MINFIADIGSNHNQNIDRAKELILQSKQAGFYGVKFQLFDADKLYKNPTSELYSSLKARQLDVRWVKELYYFARDNGIQFGCTPFDIDSLGALISNVDFIKISSFDVLRKDLIEAACLNFKHVIISLGLANYEDIDDLVNNILYNFSIKTRIELLHCVSKYPTTIDEVGKKRFLTLLYSLPQFKIGYSDHTADEIVIYMIAKEMVSGTIEVHVDLDDSKGYETNNGHCWLMKDIKQAIKNTRKIVRIEKSFFYQDTSLRVNAIDGLRVISCH